MTRSQKTSASSKSKDHALLAVQSGDWSYLKKLSSSQLAQVLEQLDEASLATALWQLSWYQDARRKQLAPFDKKNWFTWLILAGRGFGKTRTGAETLGAYAWMNDNVRCAVIAPTMDDCRKTCFEGVSGLLNVIPAMFIENYNRSTLELWLTNGSKIQGFSSEKPDRLRGPQHHAAWGDEMSSWEYAEDTWDNLVFGLRLGENPWVVVTTTPKPKKMLRELVMEKDTIVTKGSMYENSANLSPKFVEKIKKKYEGTRHGRQEIHAELLDQAEGALWSRKMLEAATIRKRPRLRRIVIALDPSTTKNENSDEFGIIVAGLGYDGHGYILEDHTGKYSPGEWSLKAIQLYVRWKADLIVGEANNGGDMIEQTIRTADHPSAKNANYKKVWASKGKRTRAEPIASLYEKGEVHHVNAERPDDWSTEKYGHALSELEDEMCSWEANTNAPSPNRMDAAVWALSELMIDESGTITQEDLF